MDSRFRLWLAAISLLLLATLPFQVVYAQTRSPNLAPLLDREPFDRLTVKGGDTLEVLQLPFPGRQVPGDPDPDSSLKVRLVEDPTKQYEVYWRDIRFVRLFERMLLAEAEKLTKAGRFDEAFPYYARLAESYQGLDGLDESLNRFLFSEGRALAEAGEFAASLSLFEELYRRDRSFRSSSGAQPLPVVLDGVADRLLREYVEQRRYSAARSLVIRLLETYEESTVPAASGLADAVS